MSSGGLAAEAEAFVEDVCHRGARPWTDLDHALLVAVLLGELHCSDVVVAAGILQAVGGTTVAEIRERFGDRVGELVARLTADPAIADERARNRALREAVAEGGRAAMMILAADMLARMRRADEDDLAVSWAALAHYQQSVRMLAAIGVRSGHVEELRDRVYRRQLAARTAAAGAVDRRARQRGGARAPRIRDPQP